MDESIGVKLVLTNMEKVLSSSNENRQKNQNKSPLHIKEEVDQVIIKEEVKEETMDIKEEVFIEEGVNEEPLNIKEEMIEEHQHEENEDVELEDSLRFTSQSKNLNKRKYETFSPDIDISHKHFKGTIEEIYPITFEEFIAEKRRIFDPPGSCVSPEVYYCPICLTTVKLGRYSFVKYLYDHFRVHTVQDAPFFSTLEEEKQMFWCNLCDVEVSPQVFSRHFNRHMDPTNVYFQTIIIKDCKIFLKGISCMFCQQELIGEHREVKEGREILFEHLKNAHKGNFSCIYSVNMMTRAFLSNYCQTDVPPELFEAHIKLHVERNNPGVRMDELNVKVENSGKKEVVVRAVQHGRLRPSPHLNTHSEILPFCVICTGTFAAFENGIGKNDNMKNSTILQHYKEYKDHEKVLVKVIHMKNDAFLCLVCKMYIMPIDFYDHLKEHLDIKKDIHFKKNGDEKQLEIILIDDVGNQQQIECEEDTQIKLKGDFRKKYTCQGCKKGFVSLLSHFNGKMGQFCKQKHVGELPTEDTTVTGTFSKIESEEFVDIQEDENVEQTATGGTCLGCNHRYSRLLCHFRGKRGQMCKKMYSEQDLKNLYDAQAESILVYRKQYQKQYKDEQPTNTCRGCNHRFTSLFHHFKGQRGQMCKQLYSGEELKEISDAQFESRNMRRRLNRKQYKTPIEVIAVTKT